MIEAQSWSFSALSTLATCERKWHMRYRAGLEEEPTSAQALGTALHAAMQAWWDHRSVPAAEAALDQALEAGHIDPGQHADACWLIGRYARYHLTGPLRDFRVVEQEADLEGTLAGVRIRGRVDAVLEGKDRLWVVERKTGKSWPEALKTPISAQPGIYLALARERWGPDVGLINEHVRTYRWIRDEHKHPPHDSVYVAFEPFDASLVQRAEAWIRLVLERAQDAVEGQRATVPVLNPWVCRSCPYQEQCLDADLEEVEL